jgi:hypothetical protein
VGDGVGILIDRRYTYDFLPAWLTVAAASHYSGLSRATLYRHIDADVLITSTVKLPGRRRGRLLINRESIDRLIEEGVGDRSCDNTRPNSNTRSPTSISRCPASPNSAPCSMVASLKRRGGGQ